MEQKKDFLDFIQTLLKYKKLLIYTFIISAVLSLVVSLLLPLWYRSSAKVFFPQEQSGFGLDMSAILGGIPLDLGGNGVIGHERLNSIFGSRIFLDDVIDKYDLQTIYKEKYRFLTRERLLESISTELSYIDQSITVSFDYKEDPQKAFEICNYMLNKANKVNMELNSKEAHNNRVFIETTYNEAQNRISQLEDSLKRFQQKHGTYLLDEQMAATIEVQSLQEQKLVEAKMEYNYLINIVNPNSPRLEDLQFQIKTIEAELVKMQTELPDYSVLLPLKKISLHAMAYYRLQREIEIGAKVLEFLTPQYEQAKIEENQSRPSFIVLDPPDVPEYKFKPKRALVVISSTSLIMMFLLVYVFVIEYLNRLRVADQQRYDKIKNILAQFRINLN